MLRKAITERIKRKCSVLLTVLMMLPHTGTIVCAESDTSVVYENVRYIETNGQYILEGAVDTAVTKISIPAEIQNKPVLVSGVHFRNCPNLKEITVDPNQNTVTAIDGVLFSKDCSILIEYPCAKKGRYSLPASVSVISDNAFENVSAMTEITLSEDIQNVGSNAFANCTALQIIHGAVPFTYGNVFSGCSALKSLTLAKYGNASGTVELTQFSLVDCLELESVTIPECRVLVSDVNIQHCPKLRSIEFPDLKDASGTSYYTITDCDALTELELPTVKSQMEGAFYTVTNCRSLRTVKFREGNLAGAEISNCPELRKAIYLTGKQNRNESRFTGCEHLIVYGLSSDIQLQKDCQKQGVTFVALDQMTGDINIDAEIDVSDAVLLARFLAEDTDAEITEIGMGNADADGDGTKTLADVTKILRKIAFLE